jgi:hypothetical protein
MNPISSRISLMLTGGALLAAMALAFGRPDYCGGPESLQRAEEIPALVNVPSPTLAPPRQQVVFLRVEADKADVEVGWLENYRQLTNQ